MTDYVLPHDLEGEKERLALMSQLLDPQHRSHLEKLGLREGWRCLEVGCGNGSISRWMAERVAPGGLVVATDIDLEFVGDLKAPCLEVRKLDILEDPLEENAFDMVTARALLHHLESAKKAIQRMVAALKPGGVLLSIEPDMLPATATEPEVIHEFWQGWLKWSRTAGIDYFIGRKMPAMLAEAGLKDVGAEGQTALFRGGSPWADYWLMTIRELRPNLEQSGVKNEQMLQLEKLYADPAYWTQTFCRVASWGHKPH